MDLVEEGIYSSRESSTVFFDTDDIHHGNILALACWDWLFGQFVAAIFNNIPLIIEFILNKNLNKYYSNKIQNKRLIHKEKQN